MFGYRYLLRAVGLTLILSCLLSCSNQVFSEQQLDVLTIIKVNGQEIVYQVELANDDAERSKGLMYRNHLPVDQGMLFDFELSRDVSMWMANTYISLDMLFIDKNGIIVNIAERTEPLSIDSIHSGSKVIAVLEINANQVKEKGIQVKDRVRYLKLKEWN